MGVFDFLKGIIPEKLINFEIDNRKVIINNSGIMIGNEQISDPEILNKLFDKISEYKDKSTLPCQIIHKDLDKSYDQYEEISINEKESLNKLKRVLPVDEVECILMAKRVKLAYDKKDIELTKRLHKQLSDNYSTKGNKVYNLIGGGYFNEMVIPFIEIFKSRYEENYVEKYREFYYDIIKFFPLAFFVGNGTNKEQIIDGINERLKLKVPFVRLHAIGGLNIQKIEEAVEEIRLPKGSSIIDNRFTSPTGLRAQILEIKIKK